MWTASFYCASLASLVAAFLSATLQNSKKRFQFSKLVVVQLLARSFP